MGSKPKAPKPVAPTPAPIPAPAVTEEDEITKAAGEDERRRLAAQKGRNQSVTSERSSILG